MWIQWDDQRDYMQVFFVLNFLVEVGVFEESLISLTLGSLEIPLTLSFLGVTDSMFILNLLKIFKGVLVSWMVFGGGFCRFQLFWSTRSCCDDNDSKTCWYCLFCAGCCCCDSNYCLSYYLGFEVSCKVFFFYLIVFLGHPPPLLSIFILVLKFCSRKKIFLIEKWNGYKIRDLESLIC